MCSIFKLIVKDMIRIVTINCLFYILLKVFGIACTLKPTSRSELRGKGNSLANKRDTTNNRPWLFLGILNATASQCVGNKNRKRSLTVPHLKYRILPFPCLRCRHNYHRLSQLRMVAQRIVVLSFSFCGESGRANGAAALHACYIL